jgi:polyhydroxybutyrate depolymerase
MTSLVFDIHGHEGTAAQIEAYTQYSVLADQQHFLVVYPQGVIGPDGKTGWTTYGQNASTVNDVLFFNDLLTALQQQLCIDPHRIYATGISNGGGMTNLLACQMAERITAFAPVASAVYPIPGGCHPWRPVPYLEFHGTSDALVEYNGNTTVHFLPVMQMMQDWASRDSCTNGPTTIFRQGEVTGFQWTNCQGGVMVQHYRIDDGGHTWPGAIPVSALGTTTQTISATTLSWQFFQQYQLP